MPHRLTFTQHYDHINKRKIEGYQRLVSALKAEKQAIEKFGTFSSQALEADKDTAKARRNFELWRKK
jgi:hypothetical protein